MASRRHNVVVVMLALAEDLEGRGIWSAGVLRQLAREVATMPQGQEHDEARCGCGGVIVQPRTGRPRRFCFNCSPQRKSPGKRDDLREHTPDQEGSAA